MMVYTKPPRQRTFTRFATGAEATAWIMKNKHRFISFRHVYGYCVVNHFTR